MAKPPNTWDLGQVVSVCKSWWYLEHLWISRSWFRQRNKAIHLQDITFIYLRWSCGLPWILLVCSWHQGTQAWGVNASHASCRACSQWLCLWGSVFDQCVFGLPCHSNSRAINRKPPWFNVYLHEAQIFVMQTQISSGYYWKLQRKMLTEEYK